ncbi:MAG: hypothetical protein H5U29_00155 [Pusillimonas sp.]|nr:hypothetical protein [Pusillimonas sp.]
MTPEQKERIKQAARELSAAMTDVGIEFDVCVANIETTTISDKSSRYSYSVSVHATTREVVA